MSPFGAEYTAKTGRTAFHSTVETHLCGCKWANYRMELNWSSNNLKSSERGWIYSKCSMTSRHVKQKWHDRKNFSFYQLWVINSFQRAHSPSKIRTCFRHFLTIKTIQTFVVPIQVSHIQQGVQMHESNCFWMWASDTVYRLWQWFQPDVFTFYFWSLFIPRVMLEKQMFLCEYAYWSWQDERSIVHPFQILQIETFGKKNCLTCALHMYIIHVRALLHWLR